MDVIVGHSNADFDVLASMLACKKLYPEALLAFSGSCERNVREFVTLHKHIIEITRLRDIDLDRITRFIIVDTKIAGRLGIFEKLVKKRKVVVHLYDHHPRGPKDIRGKLEEVKEVGATTTILTQILKRRRIPLTHLEATILALGIYEDTGSFTFPSTTREDLRAISWLLSKGANLSMVSDFMNRELSASQVVLLNELLASCKPHLINGIRIDIAQAESKEYIGDIAVLVHKIMDLENLNVIFTLVRMGERIYLIARSRLETVSVGNIAQEFGGGGHPQAASATIRKMSLERVKERLIRVLKERVKPLVRACDMMSSPVKTIPIDTTVEEARKILLRWNHTGLPVMERGRLVGIITRSDIDKAIHHSFGHSRVKGYMSTNLITVTPDTSLSGIQSLMLEHNIGRLPVIKRKRMVGIVTRTDLLRILHEDMVKKPYSQYDLAPDLSKATRHKVRDLMKERLPKEIRELLERIGRVGDELNMGAYVVGGFVRDLLLGIENLDIDIVVEGKGIALAQKLAKELGGEAKRFPEFGTAVVILPDGFKIDVATARTEFYEYPAALPRVEFASLKQDLYRRDFTINSMALKLNRRGLGDLVDFYGGKRDLEKKIVRVSYNLSFVEDPTRIFRAIRFEQRYGFRIDPQTQGFIENALGERLFEKLGNERVRNELILILNERRPLGAIKRMKEFRVLRYVHPDIRLNKRITRILKEIERKKEEYEKMLQGEKVSWWLVNLLALIEDLDLSRTRQLAKRFKFKRKNFDKIIASKEVEEHLLHDLAGRKRMLSSTIYKRLIKLPLEVLLLILTKSKNPRLKERVILYLTDLRGVKIKITGEELKELGLKPGPQFKKVLDRIFEARLDGKVKNKKEEWAMAKGLIMKTRRK